MINHDLKINDFGHENTICDGGKENEESRREG